MEIEVRGQLYKAGRIDAMKQFHVVRRLAPILSAMADIGGLQAAFSGGQPQAADMAVMLVPLANAVSSMPDADVEYVLGICLDVVERKQPGGGWAKVRASNGALMFEDIDMAAMLMIAGGVLGHNLSGFFAGLPSVSPGGDRT